MRRRSAVPGPRSRLRLLGSLGRWLRRRPAVVSGLTGVMAVNLLVLAATNAAFTATTSNSGNQFGAGTVSLTDNDSGAAMFAPTKPPARFAMILPMRPAPISPSVA